MQLSCLIPDMLQTPWEEGWWWPLAPLAPSTTAPSTASVKSSRTRVPGLWWKVSESVFCAASLAVESSLVSTCSRHPTFPGERPMTESCMQLQGNKVFLFWKDKSLAHLAHLKIWHPTILWYLVLCLLNSLGAGGMTSCQHKVIVGAFQGRRKPISLCDTEYKTVS